jgi:hypothetical protein
MKAASTSDEVARSDGAAPLRCIIVPSLPDGSGCQ